MSARIDRAAQMNNKAPMVVVTAADSSEYRTVWAPKSKSFFSEDDKRPFRLRLTPRE
jgi:hypothetical protein